jgi:hypothetical protein
VARVWCRRHGTWEIDLSELRQVTRNRLNRAKPILMTSPHT